MPVLPSFRCRENSLLVFLAVFVCITAILVPRYASAENLGLILYSSAVLGILAIAETVVVLSGGIDISVGAILAISASIVAATIQAGMPPVVSIALGLISGAILGLINGSLVAMLRLPSIIVTLATLNIFRGAIDMVMGGASIPPPTERLTLLSSARLGPIHAQVLVFLAAAVVLSILLGQTRIGRMIYAVGDNAVAAEVSGINLSRVHLFVYCASGLLAALAGVVFAARAASINRLAGLDMEFIAIGAVVVGGASLFGGSGTVRGTVTGVILIFAIYNAMVIASIPAMWQNAVTGALILAAVLANVFRADQKHGV